MKEDRVQGLRINSQGYGTIPKSVMQSQEISLKAKVVYAYFCSFAGAGVSCFPSRSKICFDLAISKDSLTRYIRELKTVGLLEVKQEKSDGKFLRNVYTLSDTQLPCPKTSDTDDSGHGKLATKNNSIKNNSINKINSNKKKKERKNGYDEVLSVIEDESLKDFFLEYIKMRKLIKAPMTDRALTMLISKVQTLEPDSIERQKKLLETAIMNNWKSVYPLKEEGEKRATTESDSGAVHYGIVL